MGEEKKKTEEMQNLSLEKLHEFPGHPFQVQDDAEMEELIDPINQYNHYVRAYNKALETRTGAIVADLLRLKHLTVLDDLRL